MWIFIIHIFSLVPLKALPWAQLELLLICFFFFSLSSCFLLQLLLVMISRAQERLPRASPLLQRINAKSRMADESSSAAWGSRPTPISAHYCACIGWSNDHLFLPSPSSLSVKQTHIVWWSWGYIIDDQPDLIWPWRLLNKKNTTPPRGRRHIKELNCMRICRKLFKVDNCS